MQSLIVAARVVVVGRACEAPRSLLYVPAVGVRRVAHVNRADGGPRLAVHTGDRVRSPCAEAGIGRAGTGVRRDHHRRVRLGDAIVDRAAGVVVVGAACEAPRIVVVRAGRGVRRAAHVNRADVAPVSPFTPVIV